jgi:hypothetical protein
MSASRTGADAGAPSLARVPWAVARAVLSRPWLVPAALAEAVRLARPGWWRRRPFLPLPAPDLWQFRMETAYGGAGDAVPPPEDIRAFVRWCASMRTWRRRGGPAL